MAYFMAAAALLSFSVGKWTTGYSILWVILVIVIVWFFQEYKAEKAVDALKNMLESFSTVIRDGKEIQVNSKELVPWDIILLETGEKIPADCVIVESKDLMVNESILTGESKEVSKIAAKHIKEPYESGNLVFMGTYIVNGRAVVQILKHECIQNLVKLQEWFLQQKKNYPSKHKVNKLVKFMATIAIVVSLSSVDQLCYIILESWTAQHIIEIILIGIALMISAFPEWLPVVLISTLAGWAYKMAKKKAIVNRMSIIETLWETTVICSDKTWTITKGEMTAKELITYDRDYRDRVSWLWYARKFLENKKSIDPVKDKEIYQTIEATVLCNNAHIINHKWWRKFKWTPTEIALMVLGHKANVVEDIIHFERLEEVPFNSERKMMSVVVEKEWKKILYSKWAPEFFMKHCTHVQIGHQVIPLGVKEDHHIRQKITELTDKKYRVLCLWYKSIEKNQTGMLEEQIIFLWAVGLQDSPRDWVKEAIEKCYDAGISVKMITWDNKDTAVAIARDVGIIGEAVTGDELDKMSDEELDRKNKRYYDICQSETWA
jgi:P-type Ca2+ transporter type 2C